MKKTVSIVFILFVLLFNSYSIKGGDLKITIKPGKEYSLTAKYQGYTVKVTPQIAVWLEDEKGNYVKTIYVTFKSAKGRWGSAKIKRPSALPIWAYSRKVESENGYYMPTAKTELNDSETGATPTGIFTKVWKVPNNFTAGKYKIKIEVNNSFDFNDTFKDKLSKDSPYYNDLNGQPSILYEGIIDIGDSSVNLLLKPVGYGQPMGNNGDVTKDLSKITTALDILESVKVEYSVK